MDIQTLFYTNMVVVALLGVVLVILPCVFYHKRKKFLNKENQILLKDINGLYE